MRFLPLLLCLGIFFSAPPATWGKTPATAAPATKSGLPPLPRNISLPAPLAACTPEQILPQLLGIPYRGDGVVNDNGQYIIYARPETLLPTPGLNCSGLTIEAARLLLRDNIPLEDSVIDRLGDSAETSPLGHDWDFGWDLIMNISEGYPRSMLLPGGAAIDPVKSTGLSPRGFDIHGKGTWEELLPRIRAGHLYLLSFSKETSTPERPLIHYHVGVIHKAVTGEIWLYQTTHQAGKSNRRNLATPAGLRSFLSAFANQGKARKHIAIIEVELPS